MQIYNTCISILLPYGLCYLEKFGLFSKKVDLDSPWHLSKKYIPLIDSIFNFFNKISLFSVFVSISVS